MAVQIRTPEHSSTRCFDRNEIDIKGHDGVLYKGRINVGKLPTINMQKKNAVAFPASQLPSPPPRSHPDPTADDTTHSIPNLEPALPRERTFT